MRYVLNHTPFCDDRSRPFTYQPTLSCRQPVKHWPIPSVPVSIINQLRCTNCILSYTTVLDNGMTLSRLINISISLTIYSRLCMMFISHFTYCLVILWSFKYKYHSFICCKTERMSEWASERASQPASQSSSQSVKQSVKQSIKQFISQSVTQSVNH